MNLEHVTVFKRAMARKGCDTRERRGRRGADTDACGFLHLPEGSTNYKRANRLVVQLTVILFSHRKTQ